MTRNRVVAAETKPDRASPAVEVAPGAEVMPRFAPKSRRQFLGGGLLGLAALWGTALAMPRKDDKEEGDENRPGKEAASMVSNWIALAVPDEFSGLTAGVWTRFHRENPQLRCTIRTLAVEEGLRKLGEGYIHALLSPRLMTEEESMRLVLAHKEVMLVPIPLTQDYYHRVQDNRPIAAGDLAFLYVRGEGMRSKDALYRFVHYFKAHARSFLTTEAAVASSPYRWTR